MSAPEPLQLVEACPLEDGRWALIVQTRGGERFILWPDTAPAAAPRPPHPGIARLAGQGSGLWAERLPGSGCRLAALAPPLDATEAAELFALIADALSALHASAQAHGDLSAEAVALSPDGEPVLLGAGRRFAEPEDDLAAIGRMWERWCEAGPLLDLRSAASLAEGLRMWLAVSEAPPPPALPALIRDRRPAPLADAAPLLLPWRSPAETVDEIGINIGPDQGERGLLDPLTWSGLTGEPTGELTGELTGSVDVIDEDTRINAPQAAVLARLLQLAHQSTDRFTEAQGVPSDAVQALLEQEPLDILPAPEAYLPSERGDGGWEDNTATAIHSNDPPTATAFTPPLTTATAPTPTPRGEISFSVLAAAVTLALLAGAAGVWLLLASLS